MSKILGLVLVAMLCSSCESTGDFDRERSRRGERVMPASATYISLVGGGCLGTCPDYAIYLLNDGTVYFKGNAYTIVRGDVTRHVRRVNYARLRRWLEENHALEVDETAECMTDSPAFTLTIADAGRRQEAFLDSGCVARSEQIGNVVGAVLRWTETRELIR